MLGAIVRTLPSQSASSMPPEWGVCGTRGSQSAALGATWNGTITLPFGPVGGAMAAPEVLSTKIGLAVDDVTTPSSVRSGTAGTTLLPIGCPAHVAAKAA